MVLIELWCGLDWKIRIGIGVLLIVVSTILYFSGRFWPWGWAAGTVAILFGGRSKQEKNGYGDY